MDESKRQDGFNIFCDIALQGENRCWKGEKSSYRHSEMCEDTAVVHLTNLFNDKGKLRTHFELLLLRAMDFSLADCVTKRMLGICRNALILGEGFSHL